MLSAIYLNNELLFRYVEVNDIIFNVVLPPYVERQLLQKIIPQMFFFGCHVFS